MDTEKSCMEYNDPGGHKTTYGTPIKVLKLLNSGMGWAEAMVSTPKGYVTLIKIEDIVPAIVVETPA